MALLNSWGEWRVSCVRGPGGSYSWAACTYLLACSGRLSEVRAQTLVVLGDKDAPDIHAIGELIHSGVAGSRLVSTRDAGHTLVMEKPDEFNQVVEDFLQL